MKFSKKITAGILTVCLLLNMISATGVTAYATEPTPTAEPLQTVEPIPTVEPTPTAEPSQIAEPTPTAEPVARATATHTHYVCGEETMICTHAGSGHTDTIEWTGISGTKTATGTCSYYLTGDTTLTIQPSEPEESGLPSNDIKICLNGYNLTIKSSESYITWRVDELSICDCVGAGKITLPANKAFNGGTFYLYGGTITGNPVRVSSFATCFYMYGGMITDCEMGVFTADGSYFSMYGGEITGCDTGVVLGTPDSTSSSSFYMYGGKIHGNGSTTTASRGSGVLIHGGNFIMYDGEISGNQTGSARGAAVSIGNTNYDNKADATFTMRGGKITGNMVGEARGSAVSIGGATTGGETVYTFNMYGGEISGNGTHGTGQADAVVIDKNGRFTMTGGKITDNKNGVYMIAGVATVSGGAYIYGNDNRNLCLALDESDASRYLTIGGAFNSGAKIGVCVASGHNATITHPTNKTDVPADVLTYLVSDTKGKELVLSEQVVTMATVHKHNDISFTEWTETTSLPTDPGNYFLTGDVTLSSGWAIPTGDTTLCLNGYDIIRDGNSAAINLYTSEGATKNSLTIYDCQNAGTITHTAGKSGSGVTVDNSIFRMYGGSISGNTTSYGAGIQVSIDAEVVLGGNAKIINNTASGMGAAVYVPNYSSDSFRSGVITIGDNVEISGNRATDGGGGVLFNGVSMTVSGNPTITGNYRGGEGTAQADNVYLCKDKTVTIGEAGLGSSAKIGVNSPRTNASIEITNAASANYAANFVSDTSDYGIINSGSGDNQVVLLSKHTHAEVTGNFTAWTPKSGNLTSGKYFLSESNATALTENITIPADETVILCLNGNTLDMGSSYIENKGTLTICDCQDTQGSITAVNTGISNKTGGTLTVSAGNITASDSMGTGIDNSGKATITGGTISGGSKGIHNGYGATLTVTGGTLSGHYCLRNAATATVTGGTFSGKSGIYNSSSGSVLNVSGGKIETIGQAGLYLEYGTATITACEISAAQYGIQVLRGANVTIDPAKDSDVWVNSKGISMEGNFTHTGQITVKGGTFTSQNAEAVRASSKITIEGGIFTTNAQGEYALVIEGEEDYTQVVIKNAPDLSGGVQFSSGISKNLNGEYLLDVSEYTGTGLTLYFDAFVSYSVGDLIAKGSVDKLTLSKRGYYLEQSGEDVILTNVQTHTHNGKTFTKWTAVNSLPTANGNYYLTNDVTLSTQWSVPTGGVTLCLNGHSITQTGIDERVIYVGNNNLTLCDCQHGNVEISKTFHASGLFDDKAYTVYGGYITGGNIEGSAGGAIHVYSGTLNIDGVNIVNNYIDNTYYGEDGGAINIEYGTLTIKNSVLAGNSNHVYTLGTEGNKGSGGAICISQSSAELVMENCELFYNNTRNSGGAIYSNGKVSITNSSIHDNQAIYWSGAVNCWGDATITDTVITDNKAGQVGGLYLGGTNNVLEDVTVTDNIAETNGDYSGGVHLDSVGATLKGVVKIEDNEADGTDKNLMVTTTTIDATTLADGSSIGITAADTPTDTTPVSISGTNANNITAYFKSDVTDYAVTNATGNAVALRKKSEHAHGETEFTKWTATSEYLTSGTYYLSESNATALTGVIIIPAGETVTLCLNGNTLDMGDYYIMVRGTLHIHDCKNTGLITSSNSGWIIYNYGVGGEGTFNLYGGTIKEKDGTTMSHGAIYAYGALTNIYGGTVSSSMRGVYNCAGSTLHIYGGTITGTSSGYGIENNGAGNGISTVNITGGTISGGAGVCSSNSYTSVKISGNPMITGTRVSGVMMWGTDNVISGGTITGSTNGVSNYEAVSVTGGSITGAEYGIDNRGTLYLSGAPEISGDEENNADIYAAKGSIYAQSNDTTPVKYTGNNKITVKVNSPQENKIIVQNVDDDNKDKFELINTNAKYVLKQSGENLILALAHTHSWSYSVSGGGETITANCTGTGTCNYTGGDKTLTIIAPVKTTYGDGKAENATLSATTLAGQSALPIVKYVGRGNTTYTESATAPTDAGTYTASITVGGKTASVDYEIAKAEPSVTWPAGLSIEVGTKLSDIDLSSYATAEGSFSWKDGETVVIYSDTAEYPMTYTPNNENYNSAEQNIKVVGTDTTAPTGQISIKDNEWFKFWNTVTFGLFYKDYVEIAIIGADTQSGVDKVEYYLSDTAVSDTDIQNVTAWTAYEDSNKPSLEANVKKFVYARITDKAGNVTYLSANGGVVVYTDSEQDTASVTYTLMTKEDKDVTVTLNGNSIQSVSDGDKVLTEGVEYTVDGAKITLKGTYLETLSASDTPYTYTVTYHPYGETYVEATGNDAPATTTFTVKVEKYKIEKPQEDTTVFTYNGSEQTYAVAESEFYTVTGNQQTNADTYTVTIAIKDEFKNKVAWADGEPDDITYDFVIGKKQLSNVAWEPIATEDFVYDGEIISISLNYDGKYSGDDLRFSFLRTGDNINVTDEGFYWEIIGISGEDAKNYKFPEEKLRSPKYFVTPRPLLLSDFTANTSGLVYTGSAMEPNVTSTNALVTTNDYTVAYENNINFGEDTAKIIITGKNNASGTVEIKFSIAKADPTLDWPVGLIGDAGKALSTVTLPDDNFSWKDGEAVIVYGEETYYEMVYTPDDTDNYNVLSEDIKVIGKDVTAPIGEITLKNNNWNSFMNNITFGLFFKETQNISITAADTESQMKEIAYHLATQELSVDDVKALGADEWTTYSSAFNVLPDNKYVVYARLSDNAGNVTYINSNGIVLYTDATQDTEAIVYLLTTKEDKVVNVTLNGNTIKSVSDGDKLLTEGAEYTVDGGKITLDGSYLDSHSYGTYIFTVTYNPLGEAYVDATGNSEPLPTTFKVLVEHKWVRPNATPTPLPAEVPQSPLTGDNTNLWMWVVVMAVSGLAVVAIAVGRKYEREME